MCNFHIMHIFMNFAKTFHMHRIQSYVTLKCIEFFFHNLAEEPSQSVPQLEKSWRAEVCSASLLLDIG